MTDDRTEDACNIPAEETHASLGQLAIAFLGLTHGLINNANSLLKSRKLGHGVRDLARPQGIETLVQTPKALLGHDAAPALAQVVGERWQSRLHADLDCLHRAQRHIGEELGRSTGAEEDDRAVGLREHLVPVQILEVLIQTVLAGALERVSEEGRRPAEEHAAQALLGEDRAPCLEIGSVDFRIDLSAALDKIEWSDSGVGRSLEGACQSGLRQKLYRARIPTTS